MHRCCSRPASPASSASASTRWAPPAWARDPATSVLNEWNQAHDVPNLFITDGSAMASSGCQNPSLTYMALSARAADAAASMLAEGAL